MIARNRNKTTTSSTQDAIRKLSSILPSDENDTIYKPIDWTDPSITALAESIKKYGLREPIVITLDGYILSGHRRRAACYLAGLKVVPVRIEKIRRGDDIDGFVVLLAEHNRQRVKSIDEVLREAAIGLNPIETLAELIDYRRHKSRTHHGTFSLGESRKRSRISDAKQPLLLAVLQVIAENEKYLPLTVRQIHYQLAQNIRPLKHASKPESVYRNDKSSYDACKDICARGRIAEAIEWHAIADETRPVTTWRVHREVGTFIKQELDGLFRDYTRDRMQSQPNHVEVVVEKNTVAGIVEPVCGEFTIPMTSGRGFCSLPPRYEMAERFKDSGKEKLIILFVSDFDPEGESIAESFALSMQGDFNIGSVNPTKCALTAAQVSEFKLPPTLEAKKTSSRTKGFVAKYGTNVWELEALPPATLQDIVRKAIVNVLDMDLFEQEQQAEADDAVRLKAIRRTVCNLLRDVRFDEAEGGDA